MQGVARAEKVLTFSIVKLRKKLTGMRGWHLECCYNHFGVEIGAEDPPRRN
jgi:hypothetical protein